jgi:hypothetical protein
MTPHREVFGRPWAERGGKRMAGWASGLLLAAALLAVTTAGAAAQGTGPATRVPSPYCAIDLRANGLESGLSANARAKYPDGVVGVLGTGEKLCTRSANQNVKLTCVHQFGPGEWRGGAKVVQNVPCVINTEQCGLPGNPPGTPYAAASGRIQIIPNGRATLTCQFRGNL